MDIYTFGSKKNSFKDLIRFIRDFKHDEVLELRLSEEEWEVVADAIELYTRGRN